MDKSQPRNSILRNPVTLAVVAVMVFIGLGIVVALFDESALDTTPFESDDISFSLELPTDWSKDTSAPYIGYDTLTATPPDAPEGDPTSVTIEREDRVVSAERFKAENEAFQKRLTSGSYASEVNAIIEEAQTSEYGTRELPAFRSSYRQISNETNVSSIVELYSFIQTENKVVTATFIYTDEYSQLRKTIPTILESYEGELAVPSE